MLAVAGDFDPRKLIPKLKAFLGKLSSSAAPMAPKQSGGPAAASDLVEKQPREQAVVLQAFPGPRAHAEDFYVGEMADELFSGMASRLFERVREEKGLAYFVRSGRIIGLEAGMFYFFAGTQPGREAEVLAEIDAEIARVQAGGVEAAELARCQTRLKAARRQGLQTNSSRAMQAGINALQGQPVNDWKNHDARIDAVTIADLAKFAQRYFQKDAADPVDRATVTPLAELFPDGDYRFHLTLRRGEPGEFFKTPRWFRPDSRRAGEVAGGKPGAFMPRCCPRANRCSPRWRNWAQRTGGRRATSTVHALGAVLEPDFLLLSPDADRRVPVARRGVVFPDRLGAGREARAHAGFYPWCRAGAECGAGVTNPSISHEAETGRRLHAR